MFEKIKKLFSKNEKLEKAVDVAEAFSVPLDLKAEVRNLLIEAISYAPEIGSTLAGVFTGKWYVHNWKGSKGLFFVIGLKKLEDKIYAKVVGLDHEGEWIERHEYYEVTSFGEGENKQSSFIQAEESYIESRLFQFAKLKQAREEYKKLGVDQRLHEGYFYSGKNGERVIYVVKDNKDLTYTVGYFLKDQTIEYTNVTFDEKYTELTAKKQIAFIKSKAVKRGFERRNLNVEATFMSDKNTGLNIWNFLNGWNMEVLSKTEASAIIGAYVL